MLCDSIRIDLLMSAHGRLVLENVDGVPVWLNMSLSLDGLVVMTGSGCPNFLLVQSV
jgi:hypothetical protein